MLNIQSGINNTRQISSIFLQARNHLIAVILATISLIHGHQWFIHASTCLYSTELLTLLSSNAEQSLNELSIQIDFLYHALSPFLSSGMPFPYSLLPSDAIMMPLVLLRRDPRYKNDHHTHQHFFLSYSTLSTNTSSTKLLHTIFQQSHHGLWLRILKLHLFRSSRLHLRPDLRVQGMRSMWSLLFPKRLWWHAIEEP